MKKLVVSSIEASRTDQRQEEVNMTGKERLNLSFQLIELALAIRKDKLFALPADNKIQWIDLKMK